MINISHIFSTNGSWFWDMSQFFVITISLILIIRQLRLQRDAHLVNSLATLDARWKSQLMLKARKKTCEQYSPDSKTVNQYAAQILYFFEELGMYMEKNIMTIDVIWEIYSYDIEHYWPITKNGILSLRKKSNDSSYYSNFEKLYNSIQKYNKKMKTPFTERTAEEIADFITGEKQNILFIDSYDINTTQPGNQPDSKTSAE